MTLTPDQIARTLGQRPFRFFEQIGSTNDEALAWAQADAPAGAVVIADEQTRGRGRQGRTWVAPPGTALMLSVVLRPRPEQLSRLTMLGAVTVADTLDGLCLRDVEIKWPNDVRVGGRKICGVLPEAAWSNDRLAGVVLGIGLNVSVNFSGTPLSKTATSIQTALGRPVERLDVLARLLASVDDWAARLSSSALFEAWRGRLRMIGQVVSISNAGEQIEGVAESVDEQGALWVRVADGTRRRVVAGDLAFGQEH